MCGKSLTFWYCAFILLVALSSKLQQNFTDNEEKNDNLTVRYKIDAHSTTNYGDEMKTPLYDSYKKSTNNTQYENMQYEFRTTSTSNEDDDSIQFKLGTHSIQNHKDDKQIRMEPCTNSTNANHEINFTSHEIYGNLMSKEDKNDSTWHEFYENSSKDSSISNIIPYEMCFNITCIQLCCPLGDRLVDNKCLSEGNKYFLPYVYGYTNDSLQSENKTVDELFPLVVHDPCQDEHRFWSADYNETDYIFFANGSLYLCYYKIFAKSTSYCLAVVEDEYTMTYCSEINKMLMKYEYYNKSKSKYDILLIECVKSYDYVITDISFKIVSISLLISIFLVYSILPELRNVHGFMLRNYSGVCFIAYIFDIVQNLIVADAVHYPVCITIAFFLYFCFLASFFWLIIMSFDMWWTFRGFCSLQRNVRQQDKRKLVFYAIFAWGLPFIFAIIGVIMEFVSKNLPEFLQPNFRKGDCWFYGNESFMLYYHGPKSICVISSICLSISTALKIGRYGKEINNCLSDSERKRYNDSKKWFNLYRKLFILLFIIMGIDLSINTFMLFVYMFYKCRISIHIVCSSLLNTLQNLCFFIIFVWKKHILWMLLKRFGCGLFLENSCATNATSSSILTCTITLEKMPIQKKMSSCEQKDEKDSSGETKL